MIMFEYKEFVTYLLVLSSSSLSFTSFINITFNFLPSCVVVIQREKKILKGRRRRKRRKQVRHKRQKGDEDRTRHA